MAQKNRIPHRETATDGTRRSGGRNTQDDRDFRDFVGRDEPGLSAMATVYVKAKHVAARTSHYVFNQLIPYIGNKRKLLDLIQAALRQTGAKPGTTFVDLFAGSGVVSRLAKMLGYRVISNDWEPYTVPINTCYVACNAEPPFSRLGGYASAIDALNSAPPFEGWVTRHLCPRNDDDYDPEHERMFYMRKNGMRIDAIRERIRAWKESGLISGDEESCLIAPLLYQVCYTSNTSGVFKGFHRGWGGQTATALYRIAGDLELAPTVFHDNELQNRATCLDAQKLAEQMQTEEIAVAYIDPPYNQHPYGSNYHVLNTVTLWDQPETSRLIEPGTKSAIRTDWRMSRRSAYNRRHSAPAAYTKLLETLRAHYVLTSYSTDGTVPLRDLLAANAKLGNVHIELRGYKRYRVSSQRFSDKPMNVEFVVILDKHRRSTQSVDELVDRVLVAEKHVLANHPESNGEAVAQMSFLEEN